MSSLPHAAPAPDNSPTNTSTAVANESDSSENPWPDFPHDLKLTSRPTVTTHPTMRFRRDIAVRPAAGRSCRGKGRVEANAARLGTCTGRDGDAGVSPSDRGRVAGAVPQPPRLLEPFSMVDDDVLRGRLHSVPDSRSPDDLPGPSSRYRMIC